MKSTRRVVGFSAFSTLSAFLFGKSAYVKTFRYKLGICKSYAAHRSGILWVKVVDNACAIHISYVVMDYTVAIDHTSLVGTTAPVDHTLP